MREHAARYGHASSLFIECTLFRNDTGSVRRQVVQYVRGLASPRETEMAEKDGSCTSALQGDGAASSLFIICALFHSFGECVPTPENQ